MRVKITTAIFPIAGMGTRFLPATKSIPKEILNVVDRPLIQYAMDEARAAGIKDFIFVTAKGKSALEDYFSPGERPSARRKDRPVGGFEGKQYRQRSRRLCTPA
jgi:UTP--glucose-1-phosphate uridylyltransferase